MPGVPMSESQPAKYGESDDGGRDAFWLFCPNRSVNSAT
jgi:hypothetical protein